MTEKIGELENVKFVPVGTVQDISDISHKLQVIDKTIRDFSDSSKDNSQILGSMISKQLAKIHHQNEISNEKIKNFMLVVIVFFVLLLIVAVIYIIMNWKGFVGQNSIES